MRTSGLPAEIEVYERLDGVEFRLPTRVDSEPRQMAGKLVSVIGLFDSVILTSMVAIVTRRQMPRPALSAVLALVVTSGLSMVVWGVWNIRARGAVEIGRDAIEGRTKWGPLGWRRRVKIAELTELVIEREVIRHINMPGTREGRPELVSLRARTARGRGRVLVAGYHRRLVEPLAAELSARLGAPVVDLEPGASLTGVGAPSDAGAGPGALAGA